MPGPFPAPLSSVKLMLAVPPGWTGADARLRQNIGGTFDGAPTTSLLSLAHPRWTSRGARTGGPRALPSRRFQALLTLFSEFFSSFPHGTCSLSVSRPYLALGGAYHPLRAAFPSSPTLGAINRYPDHQHSSARGSHPPRHPVPGDLERMGDPCDDDPRGYNSERLATLGLRAWALPASLAATEGILVGFFSSA
jgi:hypothetical protein